MKTENTKVVPAVLDGIPTQVATEMLVEPKAKMTNRMRKNCVASRAKVYPSVAPIRKVEGFDPLTGKDGTELHYCPESIIKLEDKLLRRVKALSWKQLHSFLHRMTKRRALCQHHYLKLQNDPKVHPAAKERLGAELSAAAARFELAMDSLEDEIRERGHVNSCRKLKQAA